MNYEIEEIDLEQNLITKQVFSSIQVQDLSLDLSQDDPLLMNSPK